MKQYVFFASPERYLNIGYGDIIKRPDILFQTEYLYHPTKIRRFLNLAHYHSFLARHFDLPFKKLWFHQYYPLKYDKSIEYVFIFFYRWHLIYYGGYIDYLRKNYPGCKCVLYLGDIDWAKRLDIYRAKNLFDHIMVFERNFAKEHGIEYYPLVYGAKYSSGENPRTIDLLFVGRAKKRFELIKGIFKKMAPLGLNCQFYVSGIDQLCEDLGPGFHVMKSFFPYDDTVKLLKQSKCVLDIIPENVDCNTLRVSEAIAYDIRILTNNANIVHEDFYNPSLISTYSNPDDIDISFLKQKYQHVDYHYRDKINGEAFLRHLDDTLFGKQV